MERSSPRSPRSLQPHYSINCNDSTIGAPENKSRFVPLEPQADQTDLVDYCYCYRPGPSDGGYRSQLIRGKQVPISPPVNLTNGDFSAPQTPQRAESRHFDFESAPSGSQANNSGIFSKTSNSSRPSTRASNGRSSANSGRISHRETLRPQTRPLPVSPVGYLPGKSRGLQPEKPQSARPVRPRTEKEQYTKGDIKTKNFILNGEQKWVSPGYWENHSIQDTFPHLLLHKSSPFGARRSAWDCYEDEEAALKYRNLKNRKLAKRAIQQEKEARRAKAALVQKAKERNASRLAKEAKEFEHMQQLLTRWRAEFKEQPVPDMTAECPN